LSSELFPNLDGSPPEIFKPKPRIPQPEGPGKHEPGPEIAVRAVAVVHACPHVGYRGVLERLEGSVKLGIPPGVEVCQPAPDKHEGTT